MSFAIGSVTVAPLAACTCGICAACTSRPVMRATPAPVEVAVEAPARTDSFTPSGSSPVDEADSGVASSEDTRFSEVAEAGTNEEGSEAAEKKPASDEEAGKDGSGKLTADEQRMVTELQARDREVRAHEAAHQAAGGGNVGGASYTYQQGPDGRQYAIGGEVPVDLSTSGGSPEAVIAKMAQVQAAAMAPADPSPQDFAVAAAAAAIAASARQQQAEAKDQEAEKSDQSPRAEPGGAADAARVAGDSTADDSTSKSSSTDASGRLPQPADSDHATAVADRDRPTTIPEAGGEPVPPSRRAAQALGAYRAGADLVGATTGSAIDQRA